MKELCSYLRTQCGIAETYFPLDEEGGVHSAGSGSGDPWKWAQVVFVLLNLSTSNKILKKLISALNLPRYSASARE